MWNILRIVKRLMFGLVLVVADIIGINWLFNKVNSDKIRILGYHGVISKKLPTSYWTQLPLKKFEWQMTYLKKKMNVIRITDLFENYKKSSKQFKNKVIITFDDGYENVFSVARPVLVKLGLPATMFIVTGNSAQSKYIWTDYLYDFIVNSHYNEIDLSAYGLGKYNLEGGVEKRALVVEELKESLKSWPGSKRKKLLHSITENFPKGNPEIYDVLKLMTPVQVTTLSSSSLFQIGSHSHYHPILSTLTPNQQDDEIKKSLETLSEWGIPNSKIFAYPNGRPQDFNDDTVRALRKNGIKAALSTYEGLHNPDDDKYNIKRILIASDTSKWAKQ